jgi:hypothetical protein
VKAFGFFAMPGGRLDFFAIPVGNVDAEALPGAAAGALPVRAEPDPATGVVVDALGGTMVRPGLGTDPEPVGPPGEVDRAASCRMTSPTDPAP